MATTRVRETRGDRIFLACVYTFLCFVIFVIGYPLVYIVASSFSSSQAVIGGKVWLWPVHPTVLAYRAVFRYPQIWHSYLNSLLYTAAGSALTVLLTVLMAYPLSRQAFYGRRFVNWLLIIAFIFNGGMIPFYLLVRDLGLLNTRLAMIIPSALNVFWVIIARTFFRRTIPQELSDAAQVDGCSDIRVLISIVLPLSKPIIAVIALLAAVYQWNSYFTALIFLNDPNLYPLQLVLRQILVQGNVSASAMALSPEQLQLFQAIQTLLKYSVIVVASVPMLVVYPLAQRYFVKGTFIGSLKE
jgi:ABC-type glycerol-3-phosphate transport system permease component